MKKYILYTVILLIAHSCNTEPKITIHTEVKTYQDSLGWGYDVYVEGQRSIHQPMIPAVPGNQGFANEEDAKKVGELMAHKIQNNIMPPSVDVNELDSLGIAYKK